MISYKDLQSFAAQLLEAGDFTPLQAEETAEMLVWANLRGVDSHGVLRIPRYVEMVKLGQINPKAKPHQVAGKGAISVLECERLAGAVAMNLAVEKAYELAAVHGVGWCAVRSISHAGAIGFYAEKLAKKGFLSIVMTASKPLMVYHGAKGEGVSTNPIAIGAPSIEPLIFDMSTATVALGKIMAAKNAGLEIPYGWGIDKDGRDTINPAEVKAVLPMAGAKGSGLSLMIEVLASVLVGNPLISVALNEGKDNGGNGIVIAIDPEAFGMQELHIDELKTAIKSLPPKEGEKILLPGERGTIERNKNLLHGLTVSQGTIKQLLELAKNLKVTAPNF